MKIKLRVARWIARRIATRSRVARRALRDYQRQELRRIKRDEKRTRGLRLYIAWSQPRLTGQRFRAVVFPQPSALDAMRDIIPEGVSTPQAVH